jgi:hypothetical protein
MHSVIFQQCFFRFYFENIKNIRLLERLNIIYTKYNR